MVEAAGVEPASLKPSAQMYYKLSRYCLTRLACHRQTAYASPWCDFFSLARTTLNTRFSLAVVALSP